MWATSNGFICSTMTRIRTFPPPPRPTWGGGGVAGCWPVLPGSFPGLYGRLCGKNLGGCSVFSKICIALSQISYNIHNINVKLFDLPSAVISAYPFSYFSRQYWSSVAELSAPPAGAANDAGVVFVRQGKEGGPVREGSRSGGLPGGCGHG
jgi:hypothetical protein